MGLNYAASVRTRTFNYFSEKDSLTFEQFLGAIEGKTTGALRASIGLASNFADVYSYAQFAKAFVDRSACAG